MSTALVSTFYDFGDVLAKNNNFNSHKTHIKVSERKSVPNFTLRRSSTSSSSNSSCSSPNNKVNNANTVTENSTVTNNSQTHRKLDRSLSEPVDRNSGQQQQQQRNNQANSSRYKTELCRPFEESGKCKYGDKCQFAHGAHELRTLARHPKYKTELCRTFHTIGFCPYGPRCHFIHNAELSLEGMFRPKALSISSFGTSSGNTSNGESPPSSLSESPTNIGNFCDEIFSNTPVTTPTANNPFTFNSQDFSFLISSPIPLSPSKRVQQQNAYNTALNQFTLSLFNNQRSNNLNINELDTVFADSAPIISVPSNIEAHPSSPVESATSELDELCGSPPSESSALQDAAGRNPLRLPIFSRLSTSED